jgi:hypothetical protein
LPVDSEAFDTLSLLDQMREFAPPDLKPISAILIKTFQGAGFKEFTRSVRQCFPKSASPFRMLAGDAVLSFACWRAVFDWCSVTRILNRAGRVARVSL